MRTLPFWVDTFLRPISVSGAHLHYQLKCPSPHLASPQNRESRSVGEEGGFQGENQRKMSGVAMENPGGTEGESLESACFELHSSGTV